MSNCFCPVYYCDHNPRPASSGLRVTSSCNCILANPHLDACVWEEIFPFWEVA